MNENYIMQTVNELTVEVTNLKLTKNHLAQDLNEANTKIEKLEAHIRELENARGDE